MNVDESMSNDIINEYKKNIFCLLIFLIVGIASLLSAVVILLCLIFFIIRYHNKSKSILSLLYLLFIIDYLSC